MNRVFLAGGSADSFTTLTKFKSYEKKLTDLGYQVINPIRFCLAIPKLTYSECLSLCYALLDLCDFIWVMPDSEDIPMVRAEMRYASTHGVQRIRKEI